jgi:hypothetical protein
LSCALFVPLCVSLFSRLFWVSFLAYPNLLGTKGYVVVVVVVVSGRHHTLRYLKHCYRNNDSIVQTDNATDKSCCQQSQIH